MSCFQFMVLLSCFQNIIYYSKLWSVNVLFPNYGPLPCTFDWVHKPNRTLYFLNQPNSGLLSHIVNATYFMCHLLCAIWWWVMGISLMVGSILRVGLWLWFLWFLISNSWDEYSRTHGDFFDGGSHGDFFDFEYCVFFDFLGSHISWAWANFN